MAWLILAAIAVVGVYAWQSLGVGSAAATPPPSDDTGSDESVLLDLGTESDDSSNASPEDILAGAGLSDLTNETNSNTAGANPSPAIQAIAQAIASAEGYGPPGNIPTKANNPGDLVLGDQGNGVLVSSGGERITVFPNVNAGWQALYNQISLMINGGSSNYNLNMTWAQIGAKWAGPGTPWGANVAAALGVDVNSTLGSYVNA